MDFDFLFTDKLNSKADKEAFFNIKRTLITEAISFPSGTATERVKTTTTCLDEHEAAFLKPGKEASRNNPNIYDMYPLLTYRNIDVTEKFSFEDIWEYLLKIFLIHRGTFTKTLVLLYRLCFFHDHSLSNNKWRYSPSEQICELIHSLDKLVLREGFADKFNEPEPLTLLQLLLFLDLLAWNEDVKYHAPKGEPYFKNMTESKTGRTNTLLSVIGAPLLISEFIEDIVSKTQSGGVINVKLITSAIQKFTRSRGLCVLSDAELYKALAPYLRG
ncbi:MAG: hypothetical protein FWF79_09100 [Defluviitaleaceae bacterium]|nr:hypothetical protein [Defluviitaleaceae bacterium]